MTDTSVRGPEDFVHLQRYVPAHTHKPAHAHEEFVAPPPREPKKRGAPTPRDPPEPKRPAMWRPPAGDEDYRPE